MTSTRLVLAVGTTRTAAIDGISAAGADADLLAHTPSADAEIVTYGRPVRAPAVPRSPTGCLTPAVVTRAVRDLVDLPVAVVDAGLAEPTGAPTVTVGARPGADLREADPVPTAPGAMAAAREFGRALPDDVVFLAESVPGGTTTALGVLRALGEPGRVSSSLPENPLDRKREVVESGLAASSLDPGEAADQPRRALRRMGDPVLAVTTGIALGALETDTAVTLAGGTQMTAVAALLRHAGVTQPLRIATTSYVAGDDAVDLADTADRLSLELTVTDPGFAAADHVAMERYAAGEAKEGVGMGGALALADRAGIAPATVRERVAGRADDLTDESVEDPSAVDSRPGEPR